MEEKIANWITKIVGGSMIVVGMVWLILVAIPMFLSGEIAGHPFFLKVLVIAVLYMGSIGLVATLPGKSFKRRAYSWGFSVVFHSGLLIYLGVMGGVGSAVFVIGMVEAAILVLSIIGLGILARGYRQSEIA